MEITKKVIFLHPLIKNNFSLLKTHTVTQS